MTYKDYIVGKKTKWVGKKVSYKGVKYTVVDVDYNGMLLINKPSYYPGLTLSTTAVDEVMLDK